ncbi:hypothetical protein FLJC2902T_29950 [Flavobacterium limnosediminis JC2902]|uniref:Uncharacterized protein n=1 Tax=Flavobacterium limnosediminis JC2902 TaxID=1341181 RepID=V6SN24_9FLAO|nr:hypothetical protein FLJC2902T_29950 [Flavobacterium limnosediminis JC2902]
MGYISFRCFGLNNCKTDINQILFAFLLVTLCNDLKINTYEIAAGKEFAQANTINKKAIPYMTSNK